MLFGVRGVTDSPVEKAPTRLWRISVEGGEAEPLDVTTTRPIDLAVHPDRHRIAFRAYDRLDELWVLGDFLGSGI